MSNESLITIALLFLFFFGWFFRWTGKKSKAKDLANLNQTIDGQKSRFEEAVNEAQSKIDTLVSQLSTEKRRVDLALRRMKNDRLSKIERVFDELRTDGVLLPSLVRWADRIQGSMDNKYMRIMEKENRPAPVANENTKRAKLEARQAKKYFELARNRIELYESVAPWLGEYSELTLEDLIDSLRQDEADKSSNGEEEDPIVRYVPKAEWRSLSESERNQKALDRYCNPKRKRSLWRLGVEYERYVGYHYESQGYKVRFHGAVRGREDLGIDLICENDQELLIVQCKRLSVAKGLPVRENTIAQIFGAAKFFEINPNEVLERLQIRNGGIHIDKPIRPVMITSFELSEQARSFSFALGVEVQEHFEVDTYPRVKCNISPRDSTKIYHLPMDQQYDKVVIGDNPGECYVQTVKEAEEMGFRRAYRWRGEGVE